MLLHSGLDSTDPDFRHYARMKISRTRRYAEIFPLTQADVEGSHEAGQSIDWFSDRAWFDESVKATRRNNLYNGCWWTGAPFDEVYQQPEGHVEDSYFESDFEEWEERQQERDRSLTLGLGLEGEASSYEPLIGGLDDIVVL